MARALAKNSIKPTDPRRERPKVEDSEVPGQEQQRRARRNQEQTRRREQVRTRDEIDREAVAAEQKKIADANEDKAREVETERSKEGKSGPHRPETKKDEQAASAFLKGLGSGFVHTKKEQFKDKKALKGTTQLSSIHDKDATLSSETVAESFGYTSQADKGSWREAGRAGGGEKTGAQNGAGAYAAEAGLKREAAAARREYQPSIPIEDPQIESAQMGR